MQNPISRLLRPLLRFPATRARYVVSAARGEVRVPRPHRRIVVCRTAAALFGPGSFPDLRDSAGRSLRSAERIAYDRAERVEAGLRRQRRRALWLASYGIDSGPRVIHGVVVAR
ncbi:hypothetical protein ACQPZG_22915 [Streptomyces sp. CA-294286]|uniref:hypothetical protein n=1 Tax=Streptomyces sp. CA-294286 TaxID=3240070 RepID=UPI003D8C8703